MDSKDKEKIEMHAEEIGKLLRKNHFASIKTFEEGELLLRDTIMDKINPLIAENFFQKEKQVHEIKKESVQ